MSKQASVYAQALYDLGAEEGLETRFLEELGVLQAVFRDEPDYLRLLSTPNVSKEERCGLLQESIGSRVHPYVLHFVKLLTEKNRIRQFSDCCKEYEHLYDQAHGILPVQAVTAVALTGEQQEKLTAKLSGLTGKTICLTNRVDPDCLGGVRLVYDGKLVDGTVAGSLNALRDMLTATAL